MCVRGWIFAAHCGSSPSRAIAKKMRGCPYWNTSSTADIDTAAPSATIQPTALKPGELQRARQRIGDGKLLVRHHARQHEPDDDIDQGADGQAAQDPDGQVALRVDRLLGRGRNRVEADVGKEDDRGALMNAA